MMAESIPTWTRQEIRAYLDKRFCACGSPEKAVGALLRLLRLHPLFEHREEFEKWITDEGIAYLLLYMLDSDDLTEHGGSVGGGWLTENGHGLRDGLLRESADDYEALLAPHCVHGYDVGDASHECVPGSPAVNQMNVGQL